MKRKAFRKGMTLVEVLVSSLILVIAIGSMMYVFSRQQIVSEDQRLRSIAIMIIQNEFEALKARTDSKTKVEALTALGTFTVAGIENGIYQMHFDVTEVDISGIKVYEVAATVTWTKSGRTDTMTMTTRTNEFKP